MLSRLSLRLTLVCGAAACLAAAPTLAVAQGTNSPQASAQAAAGTFADRAGKRHAWSIDAAHALTWDAVPYVPVGGTVYVKSLQSDAPAAWQADTEAFDRLKAHALHDVLVIPEGSLVDAPAARLQRLVDYLDNNGFRYGLGFGLGLKAPLTGIVVKPSSYRVADTRESLTATWQVHDSDGGLLALVDTGDDNKLARPVQVISTHDGFLSGSLEAPTAVGRVVAVLYPHKVSSGAQKTSLPDVWSGFDGYRDRLLTLLGAVKFGPGLRFFLDPLVASVGLAGETDFTIPDSSSFLMEWEAFLARRYPSIDELRQSWGLPEGDFGQHADLARLIPMWANERGAPYYYDPQMHKSLRVTDTRQSRWWQDFLDCRNDGISYYLNALCDVLKRQIADVPVVVTWTGTQQIFLNTNSGGFDGLCVDAPTATQRAVTQVLAPAYAEAVQCSRNIWCVAAGFGAIRQSAAAELSPRPILAALVDDGQARARRTTRPVTPGALRGASTVPRYGTDSLDDTIAVLERTGMKAFFAAPTGVEAALGQLSSSAARIDLAAARYMPRTLFFPLSAPGPAQAGFVPGAPDVLWLGSFAGGEALDYWPSYVGYARPIRNGAATETVLISRFGRRTTHLMLPSVKDHPQVRSADGQPITFHPAGPGAIEVTLDSAPVVITTGPGEIVPAEASMDILTQLRLLIQDAIMQKVPGVESARPTLDRAQAAYRVKDFSQAYFFARSAVDDMINAAEPYIWMEGEAPYQNISTFTEVAANPSASAGAYLRLSTPSAPDRYGYGARYAFDVPNDGRYNVWLAGSISGQATSPIHWRINSNPEQEPSDTAPHGPLYLGDMFGWTLLGTADLKKGTGQTLSIYVVDRAPGTHEYSFDIDALLLTTQDFDPNGPLRPLPYPAAARALLGPHPKKNAANAAGASLPDSADDIGLPDRGADPLTSPPK